MRGNYKIGIVALLLLAATAASAITEIGDNIIAGWVNASFFKGDGALITNINASNIGSGNLSVNRLNGGINASTTTFLRGDMTWQTPAVTVKSLSTDDYVSTIALAQTTGLDQSVTPGTYVFQYYILYNSSAAATGIRLSVNYSGTQSAFVWFTRWVDASAAASTSGADQDAVLTSGSVVGGFASRAPFTTTRGTTITVDTLNSDMLIIIEGIAVVTGDGNFELWHGSETAAQTTVRAGSSLILTKTG